MNKYQFKQLVGGQLFSVDFIKSDGSSRTYKNAQIGALKSTLRGGSNNQESFDNLICVKVLSEGSVPRTLNLDTVTRFKCGGREFKVEG